MRCKPAGRLLPEFIEGTLSPKQVDLLANHLDSCPHCQTELERLEKVIRLASNLPVTYPSPEVWENFWPELRMKIEQEALVGTNRPLFWVGRNAWKLASGTCLLVLLVSLWEISDLGLFRMPMTHRTASMDRLIFQYFTNEISAAGFQEQLNHELQRIDGELIPNDVDDLHSQVTLSSDSIGELSTSRDLLIQVIATEIDLKYFEDEDLTELISSQNGEFAFVSLD